MREEYSELPAWRLRRFVGEEWNLRQTGLHIPKGDDGLRVVFGEGLRAALDALKARRDAAWPEVPRTPEWRAVTATITTQIHAALAHVAPHLSEEESDRLDELLRRYDLEPLRAHPKTTAAALPPDDGGLAIVSAVYGKGSRTVDVTSVLAELVVGGRLAVRASNSLAGDPAIGVVKELTTTYVWRGEQRTRSVAEYEMLELP